MITLQISEGSDARELAERILPLYAEVYADPPYCEGPDDVANFRAWYDQSAATQRMRVVVAYSKNEPVGVALGYPLLPETQWWTRLLTPLPADVDTNERGQTLVLIEWLVRKPLRGQGIGKRLHDEFLAVPGMERATLTVRPEPEVEPVRAAYRAWGWRKVGQKQPFPDGPVYDLMLRTLPV